MSQKVDVNMPDLKAPVRNQSLQQNLWRSLFLQGFIYMLAIHRANGLHFNSIHV